MMRPTIIGLLLAEVCFQNKEYATAIDYLRRVLDVKPGAFEATFLMGLVQQRKGNLREAQTKLENAIGLKSDSSAAHASLGSLFAVVGNRKKALLHLATALKLKPSAPVHFLLGAVYYDAGQHKRAIGHLRKATELDPNFDEAFYQLGLLCLEMNWLKKAQECFRRHKPSIQRKPVPQAGTQLFRGSNRPRQAQRTYPRGTTPGEITGGTQADEVTGNTYFKFAKLKGVNHA